MPRRALAALLCAVIVAPAPLLGGETQWHDALAPHFEVRHEASFMPPGFLMIIEKIHGRLRMDLAMLAPWMAKERIKLYLYKSRETYAAGEFEPPQWSNGLAIPGKKTVIIPDQPDRAEQAGVIAHETTHLLFESFFEEYKKRPPSWLNEGLATYEESLTADKLGRAPWYRAMVATAEGKGLAPMDTFMAIVPTEDKGLSDAQLEQWYVQAFTIVCYLYQKHSRLQFKSFVTELRDGKEVKDALWLAYKYQSLDKFERAVTQWMRDPKHRAAIEAAGDAPVAKETFAQPVKVGSFRPLR